MTDAEFDALAERAMAQLESALEAALDASGVDVDLELKEGGVLEVEFGDGAKLVVNRHRAAKEIWVAARSGGFHFRWDGASWRDTRNATELFEAMSALVSQHAGRPVVLSA